MFSIFILTSCENNSDVSYNNNNYDYDYDYDVDFDNQDYINEELQVVCLSDGQYKVGKDISAGTYDLRGIEGYGKLKGKFFSSGNTSIVIGISDLYPSSETYQNLELTDGDEFEIMSGVTIEFTPD